MLVSCASADHTRGSPSGIGGGGDGFGGDPGAQPPGSGADGHGNGDGVVPLDPGECAAVRQDAPVSRGAVDVVWVIDSSASMVDEIGRVAENLTSFLEAVESSGGDTHVVVITAIDPATGTPLGSDPERYRFVGENVDSQALYTVTLAAYGRYGDFLRPGAPTHFVMVTDDNDILPGAAFQQQMEANLGHAFTLHAIASESVNGGPCANPSCGGIPIPVVCGAAAPGTAYNELAMTTNGEQLSICTDDWDMVFGRLESAVIASVPLPCEYVIPAPPDGSALDPNKVQVVYSVGAQSEEQFPRANSAAECEDLTAWYYDNPAGPTRINLCPAACDRVEQGGTMDIGFGCEPILVF